MFHWRNLQSLTGTYFIFLQGLGSEIHPLNCKLCVSATIAQYSKLIRSLCIVVELSESSYKSADCPLC